VFYAASQLGKEHRALRLATQATAIAISYWSLWVWNKANTAMQEKP
jgi:hypothetical protein